MVRNVGAVVVGVVVLGVVVFVLQFPGSLLYPLPPGLDPRDPRAHQAFAEFLAGMPLAGWILAFISELAGAFLGGWAAGRIAGTRRTWFAGAIVVLGLVASIGNWRAFPHPGVFIVGQLLGYPLVLLALLRLLGRGSTEEPQAVRQAARSKPTR